MLVLWYMHILRGFSLITLGMRLCMITGMLSWSLILWPVIPWSLIPWSLIPDLCIYECACVRV